MEFSKENKGVSKVTRKLKAAATAAAAAKSLQSCPTLCDPIDVSPPGSTVPGILQARTLEWGAIAFSESILYFTINIILERNLEGLKNLSSKFLPQMQKQQFLFKNPK